MAGDGETSNDQAAPDPQASHRITLRARRAITMEQVRTIRNTFNDTLTAENAETMRPSYTHLKVLRERFEELQDQIILINSTSPPEVQLKVDIPQQEFDRLIIETQALFLAKIQNATANVNANVNNSTMNNSSFSASPFRLPKLQLAKFDGSLNLWRTWYNMFKVSVHSNTALTGVEKFQYLIASLKSDALALITGLDITEANYTVAWELLKKRYHSERRHVFFHYNGLLDLPEIKQADQIPAFIIKIREHSQALKALGHAPESYDGLLTALVIRRLASRIKQRLEDYRGADESYPKLEVLLAFLDKECRSAEDNATVRKETKTLVSRPETTVCPTSKRRDRGSNAKSRSPKETKTFVSCAKNSDSSDSSEEQEHDEENHSSESEEPLTPPRPDSPKSKPSSDRSSSQRKCPCCPALHILRHCQVFLDKTALQRREFISSEGLCWNCLGPHFRSQCTSSGVCMFCRKSHHTLIHVEAPKPEPADQEKDLTR